MYLALLLWMLLACDTYRLSETHEIRSSTAKDQSCVTGVGQQLGCMLSMMHELEWSQPLIALKVYSAPEAANSG